MFLRSHVPRVLTFFLIAILLSVSAVACVSCSSTPTLSSSKQDALQKTLNAQMAKYRIPGAIVGMWFPSQGTWVVAAGKGDVSTGAAPKTTDKVRIGSLTKTFTATVVLQLVDEKKLTLDDKLSKYEPQVPGADGITIRQLLNMTSGLFDYSSDPAFVTPLITNPTKAWIPQQLVNIAIAHPPVFPPGQQYMYCNTNYILLGLIIEKLTGKTAGEAITTRIINKLGLKNTSFPMTPNMPSPYMHGYMPDITKAAGTNGNFVDRSIESPTGAWTAGAIISNLDDVKTWAQALATGKLVSQQMHAEQVKFSAPNTESYGLGVMNAGGVGLGHSGEILGYNSSMYYFPASKAVSITLINRYPCDVDGAADIVNLALVKVMDPNVGKQPTSK